MAFDEVSGVVVLHGGLDGSPVSGETWEWDGNNWNLRNTSGSPARHGHSLTFDSRRQRLILLGGVLAPPFDTWEYDGSTWQQMASFAPCAMPILTPMVYDGARQRTVVLGHCSPALSPVFMWEWDGASWTEVMPIQPPQAAYLQGHSIAYDSSRGLIVRLGVASTGTGGWVSETWEWDGGGPPDPTIQYGSACGAPLSITPVPGAGPLLGRTNQTHITGIPFGFVFMAIGLSDQTFDGFDLPIDLGPLGAPGCTLLQDCSFAFADPCNTVGPGAALHNLPIPGAIELLQLRVYLQAWAFAFGYNPLGLVASNGIRLRIH